MFISKTSSRRLQYFLRTCLQDAFKTCLQDMSSRPVFKTCLQDMSSRRLQCNNFLSPKTSSRRLVICLEDVFNRSSRRICKTTSRRLQEVMEGEILLRWLLCWRRLHDRSWRPTDVCLDGWYLNNYNHGDLWPPI